MRTLVIPIMYGEIPEHIRHTFQLDNDKYGYEVLREGFTFPPSDEVSGVIVLYADNSHDRTTMQDLSDQLRHYYPGISVIYLPVETETQAVLNDNPIQYIAGHPISRKP